MKTIESLKKVWLGICVGMAGYLATAIIYNEDYECMFNVKAFYEKYLFTDVMVALLVGCGITIIATWVLTISIRAIVSELDDIGQYVKDKWNSRKAGAH